MAVTVVNKLCPQDHPCPAIRICPMEALSQIGNKAPTVNPDKCTDCGECTGFCPKGALRLEAE